MPAIVDRDVRRRHIAEPSELVMAMIQGIAFQAVFDPEKWTAERQLALMAAQLLLLFPS
ncbi:MAG: hypothetical protein WCY11_21330 [Novosphingobium sp.]